MLQLGDGTSISHRFESSIRPETSFLSVECKQIIGIPIEDGKVIKFLFKILLQETYHNILYGLISLSLSWGPCYWHHRQFGCLSYLILSPSFPLAVPFSLLSAPSLFRLVLVFMDSQLVVWAVHALDVVGTKMIEACQCVSVAMALIRTNAMKPNCE